MSSIFSLPLFPGYSAEIAVFVSLAGFAILVRSMLLQDRTMREQKTAVAQLHAHIEQCAQEQIASRDEISSLTDQCASLRARQQRVEKHGSDTQRIDLAMRMLKRGTGDTATLLDLGLSASEIKLLMRLHSTPPVTDQSARQPVENIAKAAKRKAVASVTPVSSVSSTQGQALAQLFEKEAG